MSRRRVGAATEPAQQIERLEQPEHRHPPAQLRHRCPVAVRFADVEDDRIFAPLVRGRPACSQAVLEAEIGKLTAGSDGTLDEADYQRTVDTLMAGGSDPVISNAPEGAFTPMITDRAFD